MIERETVLVLGAGASMPYGFPLGRQLIKDISGHSLPSNCEDLFQEKEGALTSFQQCLKGALSTSVNQFLEHRRRK